MRRALPIACFVALAGCGDDTAGGTSGTGGGSTASPASGASTPAATTGSAGGDTGGGPGAGGDAAVGSGGDASVGPGAGGDEPGTGGATPGDFAIGAATIAQRTLGQASPDGTLGTTALTTQTGSVVLVALARGDWAGAPDAPTDSYLNAFDVLGEAHAYDAWPTSATGLYRAAGITGGADHVFSMTVAGSDEVTLSVVEVLGASAVEDDSWIEEGAAAILTSGSVHTDGPAMLVAWWWGSGGVRPAGTSHVAIPGDGFTIVPEASGLVSLSENGYIQSAVAYRAVEAAGDYSITWETDDEGAQLYLVAVH